LLSETNSSFGPELFFIIAPTVLFNGVELLCMLQHFQYRLYAMKNQTHPKDNSRNTRNSFKTDEKQKTNIEASQQTKAEQNNTIRQFKKTKEVKQKQMRRGNKENIRRSKEHIRQHRKVTTEQNIENRRKKQLGQRFVVFKSLRIVVIPST